MYLLFKLVTLIWERCHIFYVMLYHDLKSYIEPWVSQKYNYPKYKINVIGSLVFVRVRVYTTGKVIRNVRHKLRRIK
jgi:hypothetical protein